jgi:acyl transferase domain-containing protein
MAGTMTALHLLGVPLGWNEFHRPFERPGGLQLLDLPTYAFSDKNYWLQYNGDWCLTKGNNFYDGEKEVKASVAVPKNTDEERGPDLDSTTDHRTYRRWIGWSSSNAGRPYAS